jgi:hypothetical protein
MLVVGADEELWETWGSSGLMFATPGDKVDCQYIQHEKTTGSRPSSWTNHKGHWSAPWTITSTVIGPDIPVHCAQHLGRWSRRADAYTISAASLCSCVPLVNPFAPGIIDM